MPLPEGKAHSRHQEKGDRWPLNHLKDARTTQATWKSPNCLATFRLWCVLRVSSFCELSLLLGRYAGRQVILAPVIYLNTTYWFTKVDFGGTLILACPMFPTCNEQTFAHVFSPNMGSQTEWKEESELSMSSPLSNFCLIWNVTSHFKLSCQACHVYSWHTVP